MSSAGGMTFGRWFTFAHGLFYPVFSNAIMIDEHTLNSDMNYLKIEQ